MFDHLLITTDLSDASEGAVRAAALLARDLGARMTVLHVFPVYSATPEVAERTWPGAIQARARLDEVVADLRARGLRVDAALRFGPPAEQIVEGALERGADLIVTGTRRRRGLARIWYGNLAEEVARLSPVPVLTLPAATDARAATARRPPRGHGALPDNVILLRPRRAPGAKDPADGGAALDRGP